MTDDPFRRPDVRALLEAVAAGGSSPALVLAGLLDNAGLAISAAWLRSGVPWTDWPRGQLPPGYLAAALAEAADRLAARAAERSAT